MDVSVFFELFKNNPGGFFVAGLIAGYFLRGFKFSEVRNKQRPGRYQSSRAEISEKQRAPLKHGIKEPSFEWANNSINKFTQKQNSMSLNPPGNEI